jgi:hypothetical protein
VSSVKDDWGKASLTKEKKGVKKAAPGDKDIRVKANQLVMETSHERDTGRGKGKEKEGAKPAVMLKVPRQKRAMEEVADSSESEVVQVPRPCKKAKARCALRASSGEEDVAMEAALLGMKVGISSMVGLAKNLLATAQLLERSMEKLEKAVRKKN